jgi:hypothetical protein
MTAVGCFLLSGCVSDVPATPVDGGAPAAANGACAGADRLRAAGLLSEAETRYRALLPSSAPQPTGAPSTSPQPVATPSDADAAACAVAGLAATADRRADASRAAAQGDAAVDAGRLDTARRWYDRARQLDRSSSRAADGLQRLDRLQSSTPAGAATRWDAFFAGWLDPASRLLLPGVAILVVLLALARFAARLVGATRKAADEQRQRAYRWGGLTIIVIVTAAAVALAASDVPARVRVAGWLAAVLAAATGIAFRGWGLGSRLRVHIDVRTTEGEADPAGTAYLAARLRALGTERPRGLITPQGTDLTELPEDALSTLPEGRWAGAVARVARVFVAAPPWHASVAVVGGDRVTVSLSRNGWPTDTVLIDGAALGLSGLGGSGQDDDATLRRLPALTGAAAYVLLRLSLIHRQLTVGLCGATRWEGLAAQVLATEPPACDDPARVTALLSHAVDTDPGNAAAWLAYLHDRSGTAVADAGHERVFAKHFDHYYTQLFGADEADVAIRDGYEALRLRWLYARAAAWFNVHLLDSSDPDETALENAAHRTHLLFERSSFVQDAEKATDEVRAFAAEMTPTAALLWEAVLGASANVVPEGLTDITEQARMRADTARPVSLRLLYDSACNAAEQGKRDDAFTSLSLALGLKHLQVFARTDPSLAPLRDDDRFTALVGRTEELETAQAFAASAAKLATIGIRFPQQVLDRSDSDEGSAAMAAALDVSKETITWWRSLCQLALSAPAADTALPWVDLLVAEGLDSPVAFCTEYDRDRAGLRQALMNQARRQEVVAPSIADLAEWRAALADRLRPARASSRLRLRWW